MTSLKPTSIVLELLCACCFCCSLAAQSTDAAKRTEYYIFDYTDSDHVYRRETHITVESSEETGEVKYEIDTKFIGQPKTHYSKPTQPLPLATRYGGVSIYPSSAARITSSDTVARSGGEIRVIMYDDPVEIVIEGRRLDELLGASKAASEKSGSQSFTFQNAVLTKSDAGMLATLAAVRTAPMKNFPELVRHWTYSDFDSFVSIAGLEIQEVKPGGIAANGGLQSGDLVLEFAGQRTLHQRQVEIILDFIPVGVPVECLVLRETQQGFKVIAAKLTPRLRSERSPAMGRP